MYNKSNNDIILVPVWLSGMKQPYDHAHSPSSLKRALASSRMLRTLWMAHEYNLPKVTSKSMRLKGGIRSTSFRQSDRGSLQRRLEKFKGLILDHTVAKTDAIIIISFCLSKIQDPKLLTYPMLVPSGMTLCQPQSIAYCTDGSRKLLEANFSMVSIPSSLTSALSSYDQKGNICNAFSFTC